MESRPHCKKCKDELHRLWYEQEKETHKTELTPNQEPNSPIIDIGGDTIDLRKIWMVTKVTKTQEFNFYCVYSDNNKELTIKTSEMTREEFVKMWRATV